MHYNFMLIGDHLVRNVIADIIREAADSAAKKHYKRLSQEAQITSKIGDRIEQELDGRLIDNYIVNVVASDMPDRGRGSLDHKTGTDLYVAIRVQRSDHSTVTSKGLLIQGKLVRGQNRSQKDLLIQCSEMVSRSAKGSYVWLYDSAGVRSVPATEILANSEIMPERIASRNVGEHFRDVLDCVAGDENLAYDWVFETPQGLNVMMQEIGSRSAVSIDVHPIEDIKKLP